MSGGVQEHELRLKINAAAAKSGSREFNGAIRSIARAVSTLERDTTGAFLALKKGMQVSPRNGAVKSVNQTADAVKRMQATIKNAATSAGSDIAKLTKDFQQFGDTSGIAKAERALESYQKTLASASSPADITLARSNWRETVSGLKATAAAQKEAASAAAQHERETERLLKRHYETFAVSKRHEQSLLEIAELEARGAISAERAAEARKRATQQLEAGAVSVGKYGQALKVNQFHVTNFNHQIQDIIVSSPHQSLFTVLTQQGFQLSSVMQQLGTKAAILTTVRGAFGMLLNPMTLAALAFTGLVAGATKWVTSAMSAEEETDKLTTKVHKLSEALDGLEQNSQASSAQIAAHLKSAFGDVAGDVQKLIEDLQQAEFSVISHKMRKEIEASTKELTSLSGAFEIVMHDFLDPGKMDAGYVRQMQEIVNAGRMTHDQFLQLESAVQGVFKAQDVNSFVEHLARARTIADEIGGPVGGKISAALLKAADNGGVLNRVTADAAGSAGNLTDELSAGAVQVLELNKIDMSQGLSDATKQAAELAAKLNISLIAATNLRNLQNSKVYSGRGGDPRRFMDTPPVATIPTRTTGGAGASSADDLTRFVQQQKEKEIALRSLRDGLFKTSEVAALYAKAMVESGGAVDQATLATLKNADAAAEAQRQLEKIIQTNRSGGLQEATEQGIKSGAKRGIASALQTGDIKTFAQAMGDAVFNSVSNGIADAIVENLFAKQSGNWLSSIFGIFGAGSEGGYSESLPGKQAMPLAAFANAPHFAEGTANTSNGIPAVLHPNEAVVPLSRGRKIPVDLGDGGKGGGIRDVKIESNVTVEGDASAEDAAKIASHVGETIRGVVQEEIALSLQYGGAANPRGGW